MYEDIVFCEDMTYDDILMMSENILVPIEELIMQFNLYLKEKHHEY